MNRKRVAPPLRSEIALYWASEEGRQRFPAPHNPANLDLGEPRCFACWYGPVSWERREPDGTNAIAGWDTAHLQRAHIIPHSLGGGNAPSDYVLLCSRCHQEGPNVRSDEAMLRWCIQRPRFQDEAAQYAATEATAMGLELGHAVDDLTFSHLAALVDKRPLDAAAALAYWHGRQAQSLSAWEKRLLRDAEDAAYCDLGSHFGAGPSPFAAGYLFARTAYYVHQVRCESTERGQLRFF